MSNKNWWKAPVLQGEENDYGWFDYLIEPLPKDSMHWSTFPCKCDTCGKERKWNRIITAYFRTMDGYDSANYAECYLCVFKHWYLHKKKMTKQWLETKRWHFFGDTRIGKSISDGVQNKYYKLQAKKGVVPKWLTKLAGFTLPF